MIFKIIKNEEKENTEIKFQKGKNAFIKNKKSK